MADELHHDHLGDEIVELVLGTVEGDRRAAMAAHVLACPACRHEYDELSATLEDLLSAVPGAQPPLGFDERAIARLAGERRAQAPPDRRRVRTWLLAAAAALVALAVPLGIWAATRSDGGEATADGAVATLARTRDGAAVGSVSVSDLDGAPVVVVAIVGAPDDIAYYCRIRFADGSTLDTETWPAGNGAWVVPLGPDGPVVTSVDVLPGGTEKVWSAATFR